MQINVANLHGTDKAPNLLLANNFVYGVDLNFKLAMGWIYGTGVSV